jgi:group I intron endonuclease
MIKNMLNKRVYIGKTKNYDSRIFNHKNDLKNKNHHVNDLQIDYDNFGLSIFKFKIIKNNLDELKAKIKEEKLILYYKNKNKSYNIRIGSKIDLTEKQEILRMERAKRTQKTKRYRIKVSNRMKEFAKDPEWRKRNSESKKGRIFTHEHKTKLSEAHLTQEYKNKMTGDNSPRAIKIICNENGKVYGSIKSAANDLNVYGSNIRKVLIGEYKKTGGYTFKYI